MPQAPTESRAAEKTQPAAKAPSRNSATADSVEATLELASDGSVLATPDRSPSQRLEALKLANAVRTERASLKRDLKAGRIRIETVLLDPPECVHSAKVADIMLAVPRYGRVKVTKVLQRCRISPSKTVIGLSERQRGELVDALRRP